MKICRTCKNNRYILIDKTPQPCYKCNSERQYALKSITVCAGCGEESPCKMDCPAGTYKTLVRQT